MVEFNNLNAMLHTFFFGKRNRAPRKISCCRNLLILLCSLLQQG